MKQIKKETVYVALIGAVFCALTLFAWLKDADDFSAAERRELSQFPELSAQAVQSGLFMEKFEKYTLDQFPLREEFRTLKALIHKYALGQSDNNDVYTVNSHISKLDYPYNKLALENAIAKFSRVYDKYIKNTDSRVYAALIPDKNYFLAEQNGYPSIDYDKLYSDFISKISDEMTYIEIKHLLEINDYYYTDTHWKQESILDVAEFLAQSMDTELSSEYEKITLDTPFYGVYYGQAALPFKPDEISYLYNKLFDNCRVFDYQNQKEIPIYDLSLAKGRDPYELFLSGSLSVITIENPNAATDKELIIFRDSFASSIAPLLTPGYSKITLLDIRYMNETLIDRFVQFDNQDVLFLHSTGVINNETAFK